MVALRDFRPSRTTRLVRPWPGLASLLARVTAGRLESRVALTVPWRDVGQALDALRHRTVSGKVVLTVSD